MKKKWRIFFGIIYYFFTFSLGLMIALILPGVNKDIIMYDYLDAYIEAGDYVKAVDLLGGLYNKQSVFEDKENNVVIFEMNSLLELVEKKDEVENKKVIINASYVCIITDLNREWFELEDQKNNQSKVLINGQDKLEILQSDLDEDGNLDTIATLIDSNYICFSIDQTFYNNVNSIELINAVGEKVVSIDNVNFSFESTFFNDTKEFREKYNLFSEDNKFSKEESIELEELLKAVKLKSSEYQTSGTYSMEEINKKANKDSIIFVLVYFIWIYILGDCLVGQRYIIRFFKKLYNKYFKKEQEKEQVAFGNNFYSSVTFEIENEDFDENVILSYEHESNKDYNFKVIINSKEEKKKKIRVHGGIYQLTNIELEGYEICNLPERLEVKGYTMNVAFKIKKGN